MHVRSMTLSFFFFITISHLEVLASCRLTLADPHHHRSEPFSFRMESRADVCVDQHFTTTSENQTQYVDKNYEQPEKIHAIPIHLRPDLLIPCADLVNSEWQRSQAARVHSLQKSCPEFPVCMILLQGHGDKERLFGHARLSRVIGHSSSLFVESVVVSKAERGKGYGRILMEETERYAKHRGFKRLCLSTHDKQHFYAHIGFVLSMPVQNAGSMSTFVPMEMLLRFCRMPSEEAHRHKQRDTQDLQESRSSGGAPVRGLLPDNAPPHSSIPCTPPSPTSCIPPPPIPPAAPPPPLSVPPALPPPLPSVRRLPQSAGELVVQTLTETPYRDIKGVPIYWMHKDI